MASTDKPSAPGSQPVDLYGAALRVFFKMAAIWELTESEQMRILGQPTISTLQGWRNGDVAMCDDDTLVRISHLLAIYKAIHTVFNVDDRADKWMRSPNKAPLFNGRSAIDRMADGNIKELEIVRQYVETLLW
jgi:hypothetical protein